MSNIQPYPEIAAIDYPFTQLGNYLALLYYYYAAGLTPPFVIESYPSTTSGALTPPYRIAAGENEYYQIFVDYIWVVHCSGSFWFADEVKSLSELLNDEFIHYVINISPTSGEKELFIENPITTDSDWGLISTPYTTVSRKFAQDAFNPEIPSPFPLNAQLVSIQEEGNGHRYGIIWDRYFQDSAFFKYGGSGSYPPYVARNMGGITNAIGVMTLIGLSFLSASASTSTWMRKIKERKT